MKECNQCGKCCTKYGNGGLFASESDIEYWSSFKPEIFKYVSDGEIWFSPDTGKQLQGCPWLRKIPDRNLYVCDIYFARPEDCKHYPVTIEQMIKDECEMLDAKDLSNPKQAQKILDELLADSRPSIR